jgi:hypothetical protein
VPPKAAQADAQTRRRAHALGLEAPWVLSALPECLRQTYEASGTRAFVAARLPAGFALQASGTTLRYSDCSIDARANDVLVRRGADRYYVPAPAQLFRNGRSIALMHESGARAVLRIYEPAPSL